MHRIYRNRKITAALLTGLLSLLITVPAFAEEGQPIGNFEQKASGSVRTEATENTVVEEKRIALSDGIKYDSDTGMFCHEVESFSFEVSVPDGAIVTDEVSAALSTSLTGALYKNGILLDGADLSHITEPGKYVLAVTANDAMQTVRVSFTILASPTGDIKEYQLPTDFFVVSATLNGEDASYTSSHVDMTGDGDYVIEYRSPKADKNMRLCVRIDHTQPTATITGLVDGKANGPVTISNIEEGASAYLRRNDEEIAFTDTITETGTYVLTLQDMAGNQNVYAFIVVAYANISSKVMIATGCVLLLALAGYFVYYRRYIRVN